MEKIRKEAPERVYSDSTLWASRGAATVMSTLGGAIIGGIPGALVGLTACVADEYLIAHKKESKHYLTESTFWSMATLMPAASILSKAFHGEESGFYTAAAAAIGIAIPHFTDDFLDYRNKLELPLTSFQVVNQFFDKKKILSKEEAQEVSKAFQEGYLKGFQRISRDVKELYNNPFVYLMAANTTTGVLKVALDHVINWQLARYAGDLFISALLGEEVPLSEEMFLKTAKVLGIFLLRDTLEYGLEVKRDTLFCDMYKVIIPEYASMLIDKANSKKLLADEKMKETLLQMPNDLFQLVYQGVLNINPTIFNSTAALISLQKLMWLSPDALTTYLLCLAPSQSILKKVVEGAKETQQKHRKVQDEAWNNRFDIIGNLNTINLRDGELFAHMQFCDPLKEEYELEVKSTQIRSKEGYYKKVRNLFNNVIDVGYFGAKMAYDNFGLTDVYLLKKTTSDLLEFFSSGTQHDMDNKNLVISKERVQSFFEVIGKENTNKLEKTHNDNGKIVFKDYWLQLGDEKLINIDHFEFDAKKRYALMGKSGCGKSSFLIDLKAGASGRLSSSGEISIGAKEVMFVDQSLYLPRKSTLLEVTYFPKVLKDLEEGEIEALKERVVTLFEELSIDALSSGNSQSEALSTKLMSEEFKLSGGQSKKIAVIQAILANPKILIMDETFTGLDENSQVKVQEALNKHLPETLIISVDHHAKESTHNSFYNSIINFDQEGLTELPLS